MNKISGFFPGVPGLQWIFSGFPIFINNRKIKNSSSFRSNIAAGFAKTQVSGERTNWIMRTVEVELVWSLILTKS